MELLFISKKTHAWKFRDQNQLEFKVLKMKSANKIQSGYRPKIYTPVTNSLIHPFETSQRSVFVCFYFIFLEKPRLLLLFCTECSICIIFVFFFLSWLHYTKQISPSTLLKSSWKHVSVGKLNLNGGQTSLIFWSEASKHLKMRILIFLGTPFNQ